MADQALKKNEIASISHLLIGAASLIEDAACRARHDKAFQERLREARGQIVRELFFLEMMAPDAVRTLIKIERPAAARAG